MKSQAVDIPEISLRQLKAAVAVAQHRNLTRAANELNRSQTTITKSISDLEETLGLHLFDRSASGMMPNAYADALCYRINLAQQEFEKAGVIYADFNPGGRHFSTLPVFTMDISYKRLAAFVALYEVRNTSRAAALLDITKAAVYNSVRQLEDLLELSLFEKDPNGVSPTAFSHILARHIKLAFAEIRHMQEDLISIDGVVQGSVVVGTLPYTRTFLTPRTINRLLREYPQLELKTREGNYAEMENALRAGEIDVIIGAVRPTDKATEITTEILFEDKLSIIARMDHPLCKQTNLSFQSLQEADWVLPPKHTPSHQLFLEVLSKYNMQAPNSAVETSSLSMVRGLLLDSDRIALLSEHQIYYDKLSGVLDALPVNLGDTYRPIGITLRAHTQPSLAAALFLTKLRQVAAEIHNA